MATPARSGFPTGFVAVLVVTCLLFVITAETVANSRSSDAAGNAMSASTEIGTVSMAWPHGCELPSPHRIAGLPSTTSIAFTTALRRISTP